MTIKYPTTAQVTAYIMRGSKPCRTCAEPTWGPFRGPTGSSSEERCTNVRCRACCTKHCHHVTHG
jgi:hypothetical protein